MLNRTLARVLSIQSGEVPKTVLLFAMHLALFVGIRWGEASSRSLFLNNGWDANDQSLIFILQVPVLLITGLLYSSYANRISNQRMLLVLSGAMIAWLISVQVLVEIPAVRSQRGLYLYYFLFQSPLSDLIALHIINYMADFYDTRAAKRVLPLLLSASIAGAIVAGPPLGTTLTDSITPFRMPLAWGACLLAVIGLANLMRRLLPGELAQIEKAQRQSRVAARREQHSLRADFRLVRESAILFWMAASSLVLIILMKLLAIQSDTIFKNLFQGDSTAMTSYYLVVDSLGSIAGVLISALLFRRLLARFGVGALNLLFPSLTLLIVGSINFAAGEITAIFARLNDRSLKKVFRNSLDAMLFNSVPVHVKSRARGFINATTLPLGSLIAGLLALAVRDGLLPATWLTAMGLAFGVAYVLVALRVRSAYRQAMTRLLAEDEIAVFRASLTEFEQTDPATVQLLAQRLRDSQDDGVTIVLADMLYGLQGKAAIGILQEVAVRSRPPARAGIIHAIGADWINDPVVRQMCLDGLRESDPGVQRAAAAALAAAPDVTSDETVLNAFRAVIDKVDETAQASMVPALIATEETFFHIPAMHVLHGWLSDESSSRRRALGLRVLSKTGDARLIRRLTPYLEDAEPIVRRQVAELIGDLTAQTSLEDMQQLGLETLRSLLGDANEMVRVAAAGGLGRLNRIEARLALLTAMRDTRFAVRRQACAAMQVVPQVEIEQALHGDEPYAAECAAYVLARGQHLRARRRVIEICDSLVIGAYALHASRLALHSYDGPATRLLSAALQEQIDGLLDRVFWLAGALSSEQATEAIRTALHSATQSTRANAIESLETITTPRLARLVSHLYDGTPLVDLARFGRDEAGLRQPTAWDVYRQTWPQLQGDGEALRVIPRNVRLDTEALLTATSMVALAETLQHEPVEPAAGNSSGPPLPRVRQALDATTHAGDPLLEETARRVLTMLDRPEGDARMERTILTAIEKVIFLKQVPFFEDMTTADLQVLAGISEEASFDIGKQIIAEGDRGDALYTIVSGRVGIQRRKQDVTDRTLTALASLGPHEYFGEMSLFDGDPYSADAVALTSTHLLLVRRDPLFTLIRRQPDLALNLFTVLSRRLRQANAALSKKPRA